VRGVDDRLAQAAAAAGDGEPDDAGGQAGHAAEHTPDERAADGQRHAARPVGVLRDGHLQCQRSDGRQRHQPEHARVVEVELVTDVGQQDAERGAVEFVDGVEAEQDHQRIGTLATAHAAQPLHRMGDVPKEPPECAHTTSSTALSSG
jgi:hypothetical protein